MLRFFDFCAGIGAGRLGLESGIKAKCIGFSEILQSSINTYSIIHDVKKEKNYGDICKIDINTLPDFDLMIAGFPCQSFSVLGQRKGLEDDRGQIIFHLINILKQKKTPLFIFENVKGLVNHDDGKTIKTIISCLNDADYNVEYMVLNSLDYGVPQMRERVYFVGVNKKNILKKKFEWPKKNIAQSIEDFLIEEKPKILDENDITFQKLLNNKYNKGRFQMQEIMKNDYLVIDTRQSDLRLYKNKVPTLRTGRHGILYVKNRKLCKLSGYESLLLQGFDKERALKASKNINEQSILSQAGNAMTVTLIEQISKNLYECL